MKRFFVNYLFIIILFLFSCDSKVNDAEITFEKALHDFKNITHKKPVEAVFKYTNSGENDLSITDIKTSCGCTIPDWSKGKVKPNKKGEIKIIYDAERLGRFNKTIVVYYNEGKKSKALTIKGFVEYNDELQTN